MPSDARVARVVSMAAAVLTAAAVVLPPAVYYLMSYERIVGGLDAEAEVGSHAVTQLIGANPELWTYEQVRLAEQLARRPRTGEAERRRVLDLRGAVIAESADPLPTPWISRALPLLDAGQRVGAYEITRSLRPLLLRSALLSLLLVPLSLLAFRVLRDLPLRALRRSLAEQRELEAQLRHAQKLEAVGQLAGGMAHDFNNILATIKGYAALLRRELPADDPHRPDVEEILSAADRAASLTRNLLAFSRKQVLQPERVDLAEVVRRAGRLLRPLVREDIALSFSLPEGPLPVMADALQLEQVLMNLVTNARDALASGGRIDVAASAVTLDGRAAREAGLRRGGSCARLTVADTGAGMAPEVLARVFEPFFTTKEVGKGTGLGLAIAYGIVKQHGGAIRVASEPGKGSAFTVLLPLLDAAEPAAPAPEAPPPRGGTETLLLAEDDDAVRKMLRQVLQGAGYEVLAAADGEEAVRRFAEGRDRIRLVLLDVVMPALNGREALDAIRKLEPSTRALFLSGHPEEPGARGSVDLGHELLVSKPADPVELLRTVRTLLDL